MSVLEFIKPRKDSVYTPLNSIRVKLTDNCNWNCWWCHNEGTGSREERLIKNIDFFNDKFFNDFIDLTDSLNITEVHLTGGEPSLHPDIDLIIKKLKEYNFVVKMTSIGGKKEVFDKIISSGIDGINFSLHAVDTVEMYNTQVNRSNRWVEQNHRKLKELIEYVSRKGVPVKINTVVASSEDFGRAYEVMKWASSRNIAIRILNEVESNEKSISAIRNFFDSLNGIEISRKYIKGSSSGTIFYNVPNIGEVGFKILIPNYLHDMCKCCRIREKGRCGEYFYGIRLENLLGNYNIRLCVHKTSPETYYRLSEFKETSAFEELRGKINE